MVEHRNGECTGDWQLVGYGPAREIACARCGAAFPATPGLRQAAVDENLAGRFLRRLTEEALRSRANPDFDDAA